MATNILNTDTNAVHTFIMYDLHGSEWSADFIFDNEDNEFIERDWDTTIEDERDWTHSATNETIEWWENQINDYEDAEEVLNDLRDDADDNGVDQLKLEKELSRYIDGCDFSMLPQRVRDFCDDYRHDNNI